MHSRLPARLRPLFLALAALLAPAAPAQVIYTGTQTATGNLTFNSTTYFRDNSSAGSATIVNNFNLYFEGDSTGGTSAIAVANFGNVIFTGRSTAGSSAITGGGRIDFDTNSSAGSATLATTSTVYFKGNSTAGTATITSGGIWFVDNSSGGSATINNNNSTSLVDFSTLTATAITVGSIAGVGQFALGSTAVTVGGNHASTTISGSIRDIGNAIKTGGSLIKTGTGTLTLSGTNTFTGGTTVANGTLLFATTASIPTVGNLSVAAGATGAFRVGGTGEFTIASGLARTGGFAQGALIGFDTTNAPGGALAYSTPITDTANGALGLAKLGPGTLTLSGNNTFSGGMTVSAGTLALTNLASFGLNGVGGIGGPLSVAAGATLDTTAINSITGNTASLYVSALYGAGSIAMGNGFLVVNQTADTTWSGVLSGPGRLRKLGTGTLTLTGVNTYAAATFFNEGTILFNQLANFGPTGLLRFQGGTVKWASGNTADISSRGVWIESGTSTFDTNGNHITLANAIGNNLTGSLTKAGTGTLTLAGNNTYTGTTTITAGTLQLGNGGTSGSVVGNITDNAALAWDRSDTATLAAIISGTGSFTKAGSGTLLLTGANTYTGGTTVSAGTLQLGDGGTIGSLAGNITNNATLAFNRSDNLEFAGTIGGTGAVSKAGSGTLTLSGANTYAGGTTIGAGGLTVRAGSAGTGTITLADGTTSLWLDSTTAGSLQNPLQVSAGSSPATIGSTGTSNFVAYAGNLSLNRPTTFYDSTAQRTTFSGVISGNVGTLTIAGTSNARVTFEGTNTFVGNVKVSNGTTLQLTSFISSQASRQVLPLAARVDLNASGQLWLFGNTKIGSLEGGAGSSVLTVPGQTQRNILTVGYNDASTTFAGTILDGGTSISIDPFGQTHYSPSSALTLSKAGTGTLTLTGNNTHTGNTSIDGGTLQIGDGGTSGSVTGNIANYFNLTFNRSDNIEFPGIISGTGTLTKAGAGTLALSGANTFTGPAVVNTGTLLLTATGTLGGTPDISISTGATLDLSAKTSVAIGSLSGAGTVLFGQTLLATQSTDTAFAGLLSGPGSLTKAGTGNLSLSGDNTYTGSTTVAAGTLTVTHANALGVSPALTVAGGATLNSGALSNFSVSSLSGAGNIVAGGGTFATTQSGDTTFSGVLSGPGRLAMNGTGTLTLAGNNTFTAATFANAGTLVFSNLNNLGQGANFQFNGGTLRWTVGSTVDLSAKNVILNSGGGILDTNGNNVVFAHAIGGNGAGGLTKTGAGTLTLAGLNTYTGATAVNAGQLALTGSSPSSAFSVNSGATLSGTGSLAALAVNSGGTVAPGASPGTLSVSGNTTFNSGGIFAFEINNAAGLAGTHWDLLSISGSLTLAASAANPFTVSLTSLLANNSPGQTLNFNSAQNSSYTFASAAGGILGFSPSAFSVDSSGFANPLDGGTWSIAQSGNNLNLTFTASAIPEPSTYAAIFGVCALGLAAYRRRRKPARSS